METKPEQYHEHLTEEEKNFSAQIRSVAATLYERVDLDKPTLEFLREHFHGPKGGPNNLQSVWRLAELFFRSDLS